MECVLCNSRKDDRQIVLEKGKAFSIVNFEPLKEGHLMVLPSRHVTELSELEGDELKDMHELMDEISGILTRIYKEDVVIALNRGKHSTQPHIHYHILPAKNGLRHLFSSHEKIPQRRKASWEELAEVIDKIKKEF